jgi:signal transduction histidine kinase
MEKSSELPFLGMIKGRVNHLDGFIRDILDYSRNARTELQQQRIDFSQLLEQVKANLKLINGFDRLKIQLKLNGQMPFYSDPARLLIIFNNLVSNSVEFQDYFKPDPTLMITITIIDDRAEILATDNGIGIAAEHLTKIYDMFYRATDRSRGSGLGLYIVKETVAKLHGTIKAKSKLGEFTTFEIVIPNAVM